MDLQVKTALNVQQEHTNLMDNVYPHVNQVFMEITRISNVNSVPLIVNNVMDQLTQIVLYVLEKNSNNMENALKKRKIVRKEHIKTLKK